ncbi:MAG: beta-propeller fold lactonase family protein [Planctomycetota bacterium]
MLLLKTLSALLLLAPSASAQGSFVNFEGPQTHPIRVSADGARLFTVLTPDARLCVWSLSDPDRPVLLDEIPVGQEPVSVTPRTSDEVWVANWLSDTVSVVSLPAGAVVDTLRVADEPADVAFAQGRAFVSAAASDAVHVFDAETRELLGVLPIEGKDPRALAVSPDGATVYALIQRSGNRTTVIPKFFAPPPPAPTNPELPAPPQVSLIVSQDDPDWAGFLPFEVDDFDVAWIDAASLTVTGYTRGVGTILHDLAVDPASGDLFVANTDARNTVRFEPNLRGHAIDSRITRVPADPGGEPVAHDLNPGIDYSELPSTDALASALSEPTGIVFDDQEQLLYVAAQGTDRVGVVATDGAVIDRIEVGDTPGATVATRSKRGPRGLALLGDARRLYVLNRLSQTVSVVDLDAREVTLELPNGSHDPTPEDLSLGRRFLYDAKLSGNGTLSCAACHWDAEMDVLAWDLGDPGGELGDLPTHPDPVIDGFLQFQYLHPMKGPMLTKTLRGLADAGPLHWRGDMPLLSDFNSIFDTTMGGVELAPDDLGLFVAYGYSIAFPPNPNLPLDGQYTASQAVGLDLFQNNFVEEIIPGKKTCNDCHALPYGTNGEVLPTPKGPMKPSPLRTMYRREGFNKQSAGVHKSGYGVQHDGDASVWDHFTADVFQIPEEYWDEFGDFMLALDTGTPPAVGHQMSVDADAELATVMQLAGEGQVELIARGELFGERRGLLYDPAAELFRPDAAAGASYSLAELQALSAAGDARLVLTGVPAGTGVRAGIDRDLDGTLDRDELGVGYGAPTPGCGAPSIGVNSEPYAGNANFAFVGQTGVDASGALVLGNGPLSLPVLGVELLAEPDLIVPVTADATGLAAVAVPLDPSLTAGALVFAQLVWADPCGPAGFAASAGLALAVQPQ